MLLSKRCVLSLLILTLCLNMDCKFVYGASGYNPANSEIEAYKQLEAMPEKDSRELQIQDMLILFLLPHLNEKLAQVYADILKGGSPDLYPYFVDVIKTERVNGFRGFDLRITLQAVPTVGPHIPVGEDRFTYQISPVVGVKLIQFEHLKGPNKADFPPNYQDLLR